MSTTRLKDTSPTSSGTSTPNPSSQSPAPAAAVSTSPSTTATTSYLPALSHAVTGFLRRLSSTDHHGLTPDSTLEPAAPRAATLPISSSSNSHMSGVYTPPNRTASPFHPPPLQPLVLKGYTDQTDASAQLLTRAIAEEIRLLVPARLQLVEDWNLVYSLDQDGVSLGTLYAKCKDLRGLRNGYVLVVKDGDGGLFGAYLTEAPHPSPHYFGTGECFLWRAAILSPSQSDHMLLQNLPPPPSSDTTNLQRSTTLLSSTKSTSASTATSTSATNPLSNGPSTSGSTSTSSLALPLPTNPTTTIPTLTPNTSLAGTSTTSHPRTSTPTPSISTTTSSSEPRIRFKAFPYSGINDYLMLCETSFFSIGGGDGHYGLWLDDNLERGISSSCPTFGNEPLSEEGEKFGVLGVEVWCLGSLR